MKHVLGGGRQRAAGITNPGTPQKLVVVVLGRWFRPLFGVDLSGDFGPLGFRGCNRPFDWLIANLC